MAECEFCGKPDCVWQRHAEARADAKAWEAERLALEFPFGDHVEVE